MPIHRLCDTLQHSPLVCISNQPYYPTDVLRCQIFSRECREYYCRPIVKSSACFYQTLILHWCVRWCVTDDLLNKQNLCLLT